MPWNGLCCDGWESAKYARLFSDAEGGEDAGEDVVGGGDAREGVECAEGHVQVEQNELVRQACGVGFGCGSECGEGVGDGLLLAQVVEQAGVGE